MATLVLLDNSKCFDVVPHQLLLEKLTMYGIDTDWFADYLAGHTQQVRMRGANGTDINSRPRDNSIGVFQGGSLSCVLFMLFSNDLSLYVPEGVKILQFADDTQILIVGKKKDLPIIVSTMESALDTLYQWFCRNGMKVNTAKTQMLVLGTPGMLRTLPPVTVTFCGTAVNGALTVKNLGLCLDRHLNYQAQVDAMTAKCTGMHC